MATTERRKSISLFFGFGKPEAKADPIPDGFPKLRRKLQKVTKLVDVETNNTNMTTTAAPAPDVGGVQTVKVPGDDSFLSTKYDATRPPPSCDGSKVLAAAEVKPIKEEKRTRRDSKPQFFFRSSSTSRVPNSSRSASCTRVATTTAIATRPDSSRGESSSKTATVASAITTTITPAPASATTECPSTATFTTTTARTQPSLQASTSRTSSCGTVVIDSESRAVAELQALADAQDKAMAQKKAAQAAAQARAMQMMEEHERISAREWLNSQNQNQSQRQSHSQRTPPSASRTKRTTRLSLTLGAPQQQQQQYTTEKPATAQQYPQFHRPYSHSQHQNSFTTKGTDVRRTLSTTANPSPYVSRPSASAVLPPIALPSMPMTVLPLSPILSSAVSEASSTSLSSPTSATFNLSSASLALTAATSFTQSYSTLPMSAHGSALSCATSSPDGSVVGSPPYPLGRRKNSKYDFDNESTDSSSNANNSGSDGRCVVPELSYLSRASSRGPPTPDSPVSISSVEASSPTTKPRRKVKTPVYAIGQLESGASADDAINSNINKQVELILLQSKSSIECIAEEYRALLASRNSQSTDAQSELNVDVSQRQTASTSPRSRNSCNRSSSVQAHSATVSVGAQRKFMLASPNATNAFNADACLDSPLLPAAVFQEWLPRGSVAAPPMTASPLMSKMTPPPPLPPLRTRSSLLGISHKHGNFNKQKTPPPPSQPDNLGLQICVDLLTRELSSAVVRRSSPAAATAASQRAATRRHLQQNNMAGAGINSQSVASPPTNAAGSALQILVMIEAYERLRDQLVADAQKKMRGSKRVNGGDASSEEIESMFGLWLKALYRIHDSLTCEEKEDDDDDDNDELDNTSDSEYDSAAESI